MNGIVRRRAAARRDLVESYRYYAREGSIAVADRFLAEAEATLARLAGRPGLGTRYEHDYAAIGELRHLSITRFRKHLVFYRPIEGGIEVVRVLHGSRDIAGILAEDFGVARDDDAGEGVD